MSANVLVTWAFAMQHELGKIVQEEKPEEVHRWPLLRSFAAEGYAWKDTHVAVVLRDALTGIPSIGDVKPIDGDAPNDAPAATNIESWLQYLRSTYRISGRDMAMVIPVGPGPNIEADWATWSMDDKQLWRRQLVLEANRQLQYLEGLDARKGQLSLGVPPAISESLAYFRRDHPLPEKTGFLMMRLASTPAHNAIAAAVRATAEAHGLTILRADDKEYHAELYFNVLTYVYGSGFGVAVMERLEEDEFNPNVSFEIGYMLGLNKPVCILKDRTLKQLHTDLLGKLYRQFDPQAPGTSIREPFAKWLRDKTLTT